MDGFERRREKKKAAIRQAAFDLFSKYGIHKASIEEIAKKATVSQVTIYNYFGSKDELIMDIIQTYTEKIFDNYEEILKSKLPFQQKLERIIEQEIEVAGKFSSDFMASITEVSPEIQQYFQSFMDERGLPFLMTFINEGKASGYIDPALSDEVIFFYVNMYYRELMHHPELYNDEEKKTRFVKETLQLFFYGLVGKKGR